ncbi:MAG: sterol desaturase family protein [Alphaproteobacteria bacterium]|nr:sterol desaturase family protein [Alphaproteobacteria bacterium]
MDDLKFGTRDKRGDWKPAKPLETAPLFVLPPQPVRLLQWLPGYIFPWNILFLAIGAALWFWLTPSAETLKTLAPGWVSYLLVRNALLVLIFFGALELRLYVKRRQGTHFKYNAKFPAEQPSDVFYFKSQNIDNAIRTFGLGVPFWTAYEVFGLWAYANGIGPWSTFAAHPIWFVVFALAIPVWHEFHFYCIHRLIHVPVLYKWIHYVHHNSVNPSPWSSLSMHPVESFLYWSDSLIHLILPSHPLLLLYHLQVTGSGAVIGHIGFDKIELGNDQGMDTHAYAHYLHHKYFEVNYADGTTALDKLFGTWHDGSKEAQARMEARYARKVAQLNQQNS